MKRLLSLILTGLFVFSAACTTAHKPQSAEEPTAAPTAAPTAQPTEAPTEQPAPSDEDISGSETTAPTGENAPEETPEPVPVSDDAEFAFALAAKRLDGKQNRNLSPISVYLAMAMVAEGAKGDTQTELLNLLGCESIEQLRGTCAALLEKLSIDSENSTLDLHNSLWMTESLNGTPVVFHDSFLAVLGETYRSEANTVDFARTSAARQIADWITTHTRGKIKISDDALRFDPETIAVLINTIYLKDVWNDPFDKLRTDKGIFYGFNESGEAAELNVEYMHRGDRNVTLVQGDGWLRYRVYLAEVGYVSFVLPDEGISLDHLLGSPEAIEKLLRAGINKTCNVSLMIPKFSFQDKMELDAVLASMGLKLSFTDNADFSGMTDASCRIDRVLQESYIGVDEYGVEAAAYTMVSVKASGIFNPVELETIDFHLTRPFLYAIESYDGTVLFVGTVTTPNAPTSALNRP